MRKISLIVLFSLGAVSAAFAQPASNGITTSTDPAKVAAAEQRAQKVKSSQSAPAAEKAATHHAASAKSKAHTQKTAHAKPKTSPTKKSTGAKS